jgi:hypothetical protein
MAKKSVAASPSQKGASKKMTKVIKFIKGNKGAYIPKTAIFPSDEIEIFFSKK